jgi:hypothetical protein
LIEIESENVAEMVDPAYCWWHGPRGAAAIILGCNGRREVAPASNCDTKEWGGGTRDWRNGLRRRNGRERSGDEVKEIKGRNKLSTGEGAKI